jgi:hypothetical protein
MQHRYERQLKAEAAAIYTPPIPQNEWLSISTRRVNGYGAHALEATDADIVFSFFMLTSWTGPLAEQLLYPPPGCHTLVHVSDLEGILGILKNGPITRTRTLESDFGPGYYCFLNMSMQQLREFVAREQFTRPSFLLYYIKNQYLQPPNALDLRGKQGEWQELVKAHKLFLPRPAAMYNHQAIIGLVTVNPQYFMRHGSLTDPLQMLTWHNGSLATQVAIRSDGFVRDLLDKEDGQRVVVCKFV